MRGMVLFIPHSNMLKNKFLLIPFLIFIISFAIDRIFMLESIQTYFTKTVSEINYFHKPILFNELKEYLNKPDRKKVLVYFGSSRALLFNNKYIEENYPNWLLFNFSVPGGTPDYFFYWLEKFKSDSVKPDFILIDSSIEAFNLDAKIKIDEVLINGLDFQFIFKNFDRYSSKEISNFIAKRLFKTYQYRPKLETILQRLKNNSEIAIHYRKWRRDVIQKLTLERGSASSDFSANRISSDEVVAKFSNGDYYSYIDGFRFNENMLKFQKDNFKILNEMKLNYATIVVKVANPYYQNIKTRHAVPNLEKKTITAYSVYYPVLNQIANETETKIFNMNEDIEYSCSYFTDASHMSSKCFPDYTDFIFNKIMNVKKTK